MSNNKKRSALSEILQIMGDALATAASVRQGRLPRENNLRGLGINPEQFRQIAR